MSRVGEELEQCLRRGFTWSRLPAALKQQVGSERDFANSLYQFGLRNQLRFDQNQIGAYCKRLLKRSERQYYEDLVAYGREHLLLYPYHLQAKIAKGLGTTPFHYYVEMVEAVMHLERSYDCLPNFTAADCVRILGIGRNQYIEAMNRTRSGRKILGVEIRRRRVREHLPQQPIDDLLIQPWWIVHVGFVPNEAIQACSLPERRLIDLLIDQSGGGVCAGSLDYPIVKSLYTKGLLYLDVPISDEDCIVVPTLEGFVMNRVMGDSFENLLYKIFISIDEHTSVSELASVLQADLSMVKTAISLFCRLGFAFKKQTEQQQLPWHSSWAAVQLSAKPSSNGPSLLNPSGASLATSPQRRVGDSLEADTSIGGGSRPKIAFLFDSTLTAYLMMGNLSPGLKNHAVTMFEVGKLSEESMDSFLAELDKVEDVGEGEVARYFWHAVNLRDTVVRLRHNASICGGLGLDLLRTESLLSLEPLSRSRILAKNYAFLVSMAPISQEDRTVMMCSPLHLGPPIPEVNSIWFKLFLYQLAGSGPHSLLLAKGTRLSRLPKQLRGYATFLVTAWGHDPSETPASNVLATVNDALAISAVLLQGYSAESKVVHVAFPTPASQLTPKQQELVDQLFTSLQLHCQCGYVSLLCEPEADASCHLLDLHFGVPLFDSGVTAAVCDGLIQQQLLSDANRSQLLRANRLLSLTLLDFISRWAGCEPNAAAAAAAAAASGNGAGSASVASGQRRFEAATPLPTRNLQFFNSALSFAV